MEKERLKDSLVVKIIGSKSEILALVSYLERAYFVIATSQILKNDSQAGKYHQFVTLVSRELHLDRSKPVLRR